MKQAVISDVELTHANPVVQEMVFVYCDTIRFLLCNFNDEDRAQEAFQHAQELSEKPEFAGSKSKHQGFSCQELLEEAQQMSFNADYKDTDLNFLNTSYNCLSGQKGPDKHVQCIKHAFVLGYYFLLRSIKASDLNLYYEKVLKETIQLGGDTDANACIITGLIGSLVGIRRVPIDMLSTLVGFNDASKG